MKEPGGKRGRNQRNRPRTRANLPSRDELEAMSPGRRAKALALITATRREIERERLTKRWSHKNEGTPETHERASKVRQSPIHRMHALGKITNDQLLAAQEIAGVVEMIERGVSVKSASLEARVDCSNSARDGLIESLGRIRLEVTYRAWRQAIPMPRRMIIDILTSTASYVRIAAKHGLAWRTARRRLVTALDMWLDYRELVRDTIDERDVAARYARLGEGVLLPPRARPEPDSNPSDDEAA